MNDRLKTKQALLLGIPQLQMKTKKYEKRERRENTTPKKLYRRPYQIPLREKQTKKFMESVERKYEDTSENMQDAYSRTGVKDRLIMCNPSALFDRMAICFFNPTIRLYSYSDTGRRCTADRLIDVTVRISAERIDGYAV